MRIVEHAETIEISAALEVVYAAICALDWLDDQITVTRLSGSDGLGGVYELQMRAFGSEHELVFMLDGTDAPGRVSFASVGCRQCTFNGEYLLHATPGGTDVTLSMRATPLGRWRAFQPMLPALMQRSMKDALQTLKAHLANRQRADAA